MQGISEIVLTGGPCAGKTSALSRVQRWLMDRGYRVFLVPEVATILIQGGVHDIADIAIHNPQQYLHFQRRVLEMEMMFQTEFRKLAEGFLEPSVIIYDRGPMDGCAYVDRSLFEEIIQESRWNFVEVRDGFDAVIHLVTAADGAEQYYTTVNNTARHETPEEARALDRRTQDVWVGNPHLKIISNDPPGFDAKMMRTIAAIARVLGIPVPLEIERKFLLKRVPAFSEMGNFQPIAIEQIYLQAPDGNELRIRARTAGDKSTIYYRTEKKQTGIVGMRNECEKTITASEYKALTQFQESGTRIITKTRYCFISDEQYFELDVFVNPSGVILLEIELTEANGQVVIPSFIDVEREVTGDLAFSNHQLAKL